MGFTIKPGVVFSAVRMDTPSYPIFNIEVGGQMFNVKPDRVLLSEFLLKIVEPEVRKQIEKLSLALPSAAEPAPVRRIKRDDDQPEEDHDEEGDDFDDG